MTNTDHTKPSHHPRPSCPTIPQNLASCIGDWASGGRSYYSPETDSSDGREGGSGGKGRMDGGEAASLKRGTHGGNDSDIRLMGDASEEDSTEDSSQCEMLSETEADDNADESNGGNGGSVRKSPASVALAPCASFYSTRSAGNPPPVPLDAEQLAAYNYQAAGHHLMFRYPEGTIVKESTHEEARFYACGEQIDMFQPFIPQYKGTGVLSLRDIQSIKARQQVQDAAAVESSESEHEEHAEGDGEPEGASDDSPPATAHPGYTSCSAPSTSIVDVTDTDATPSTSCVSNDTLSKRPPSVDAHRARNDSTGVVAAPAAAAAATATPSPEPAATAPAEAVPLGAAATAPSPLKRSFSSISSTQKQFIILRDITDGYKRPCVLDIKMGIRNFGLNASAQKRRTKVSKTMATTSYSLGFRLHGLKVFDPVLAQYRTCDKMLGRSLRNDTIQGVIEEMLSTSPAGGVNTELCRTLLGRLEELRAVFETQRAFQFYTSSLLLYYDHDDPVATAGICMVDFAFTYAVQEVLKYEYLSSERDEGYLFGLKNLIALIRSSAEGETFTPLPNDASHTELLYPRERDPRTPITRDNSFENA